MIYNVEIYDAHAHGDLRLVIKGDGWGSCLQLGCELKPRVLRAFGVDPAVGLKGKWCVVDADPAGAGEVAYVGPLADEGRRE